MLRGFLDSFARVQNGETDNLVAFVADDHVIVRQFAVGGVARLLVVHIQRVRLGVVRQPNSVLFHTSIWSTRRSLAERASRLKINGIVE